MLNNHNISACNYSRDAYKNIEALKSNIHNAYMAEVAVGQTRTQILSETGTAMLTHVLKTTQGIAQLLA